MDADKEMNPSPPGGANLSPPNTTLKKVNVEAWDSAKVVEFIATLGAGKCWERYGNICLESEIDGSTLIDADSDLLVEMGFLKIHANKVLKALKKIAAEEQADTAQQQFKPVVERKVSYPCYLPLTAEEGERMMKFAEAYELIRVCTEKAQNASEKIQREKDCILQKVEKNFMSVARKLETEKTRICQMVKKKYGVIEKRLSGIKDQLESSMDVTKMTEKTLNKQSRITEWSEQKARKELILKESAAILETVHPFLVGLPSLDVAFDDYIFSKLLSCEKDQKDGNFHVCALNITQPVVEGKSVIQSEKAKREEAEKRQIEEGKRKLREAKQAEERKTAAERKDWETMRAAMLSGSGSSSPKSFDEPKTWIPLKDADKKAVAAFFEHVKTIQAWERRGVQALQELNNHHHYETKRALAEFKALNARIDRINANTVESLAGTAKQLRLKLQISIETLRKHLNEDLPKVEIELNKRIKVTDFSLLEERSKSIRELVKATIEKPHPFLLTMPNVSITLSQEFKEAKTEKLVTVNCTDATTMPKWTLGVGGVIDMAGGFEALLETLGGFEALLKTLGGFEALCKGAGGLEALLKTLGGFEALLKTLGGFEALCKGAGGFEALCKGAGGFEALLKTLGGFEALLKTLGGFEALCKGAGGFEALCKGAGGFEALCKGAGGFEALLKTLGGFEALLKTLGGFEALCKGAGGFEALCKGAGGFEALLKTLGGFEALCKGAGGFEALCKGAGGFQKLCKVGGGFKALVDGVGYENWLRLAVQPSQIFRNGERYPMDVTGNGKVVTSSGRAHAFVSGADNDHCIVKVVQQGHCPYSGIALLNSSKKYSGGSNDLMCPFQDGDMRNAFGEKRETPSFSNEAVVIFAREEQHVTWCVNGKHERFARPSIETNLVVVSNGGRAKYKIM